MHNDEDIIIKLYNEKNFVKFEEHALSYLKKNPKNIKILNLLSEVYINTKRFNSSKKILIKVLDLDKNQSNALLNLARLYFMACDYKESIRIYSHVLKNDKNLLEAIFGISMCFQSLEDYDTALLHLSKLISIDKSNNKAYHAIGEIYKIKQDYEKASSYYALSSLDNSKVKFLECQFLLKNEKTFFSNLEYFFMHPKYFPLVASLSKKASIKFSKKDKYRFCEKPLNSIYKKNLKDNNVIKDDLTRKVFEDFNNSPVTKRDQNLLVGGFQSGDNIFDLETEAILKIKNIIANEIENYKNIFKNSSDKIITKFPEIFNLNGWIIRMQKGDYLKPHMHENGWLSGSIYLNFPNFIKPNEGCIKFSLTDEASSFNDEKLSKVLQIEEGDIIIFPSSLYHQTIPFTEDNERIVLAFDIEPLDYYNS